MSGENNFIGYIDVNNLTSATFKYEGSHRGLFQDNTSLTSFDAPLSELMTGNYMFRACSSLTDFQKTEANRNLQSLMYGQYMFYRTKLSSFYTQLPNLEDGQWMFGNNTSFTTFGGDSGIDMSKLKTAYGMFSGTRLTKFVGDLNVLQSFGNSNMSTYYMLPKTLQVFASTNIGVTDASGAFAGFTNSANSGSC